MTVAPIAPEELTILHPDAARICIEAGGTIDRRYGCVLPDGSTMNTENRNTGSGFQVKTWMYVAGGVGALGILWYLMR